jgi:predicted amidohydrolase
MQDLSVTIVQSYLHWGEKEKNLEQFSRYLSSIENSHLVVLPEMFNTGFTTEPESYAEEVEGPTLKWMQHHASKLDCVLTGSFIVKSDTGFYNRLFWVRSDGSYDYYDKRHLFRMAREDEKFSSGKSKLVVNINGWKVLPLICYDLRFPVWSKNRYLQGDYEYDILIYVANWPQVRSNAWKSLLVARAIENQSYVIGVNRIGKDGNGVDHSGDSCIIDPKGNYLLKMAPSKQAIDSANLSFQELEDFRLKFRVGLDWDQYKVDLE